MKVKRLFLICLLLLLGFALVSCESLRFEGRWVMGHPPDVPEGWRLSRIETDYYNNGVINSVSLYEYANDGVLREILISGDTTPVKRKSFEFTFKDDDQLDKVKVDYENFKGKIYRFSCNVDPSGYGTPVPPIDGHQDTQSRIESFDDDELLAKLHKSPKETIVKKANKKSTSNSDQTESADTKKKSSSKTATATTKYTKKTDKTGRLMYYNGNGKRTAKKNVPEEYL